MDFSGAAWRFADAGAGCTMSTHQLADGHNYYYSGLRDVAVSGWFHNLRKGGEKFHSRFPTQPDYVQYLVQSHWVSYIQAARSFGQSHPQRYLELRYEQLHDDPEGHVLRMLDFLDVDRSSQRVGDCVR